MDSRATKHVINQRLLLLNFQKCTHGEIKNADKKQKADIKIDVKGNSFLHSKADNVNVVKLTNVLAAGDVASNLYLLENLLIWGFQLNLMTKTLEFSIKKRMKII